MSPWHDDGQVRLYLGDVRSMLAELPAESAQCVVTSPPYWSLRDYGVEPGIWGGEAACAHEWQDDSCGRCGAWRGALGLEPASELYVAHMVEVFRAVRRVLAKDGTLWLNIGDSYAGSWGAQGRTGIMAGRSVVSARQIGAHPQFETRTGARGLGDGLKPKDLVGIPWMLAFALRADGWWLRQDIIWHKPSPMPESVTDRCTKAHEYLFLLSKSERYWSAFGAIREPVAAPGWENATWHGSWRRAQQASPRDKRGEGFNGLPVSPDSRNKRSVWTIPTAPFPEAHFATFPPALVEPCVLAGSREGDVVLDPFVGSGTTAMVARRLGRKAIGIDLNADYLAMAVRRVGEQLAMEMAP